MKQNSAVQKNKILSMNFDFETRVGVDNDTKFCVEYQNFDKILLQKQNSHQKFDYLHLTSR